MTITISRNGATLGSFAEAEVRAGLSGGRFRSDDHAWREGLAEWQPLGRMIGLGAAPPPLPPHAVNPFQPLSTQPPPLQARKDMGDDAGIRFLLPVGRSAWAIAAGYLGLFALLAVPAPLAVIVSVVAIRDIQKSKRPGQKRRHGMGRAIFGLVAGIGGSLMLISLLVFWFNRPAP